MWKKENGRVSKALSQYSFVIQSGFFALFFSKCGPSSLTPSLRNPVGFVEVWDVALRVRSLIDRALL
jgi:hypothetical protein